MEIMVKCPNCGAENPDNVKFCLRCGSAIEWWKIRTTGKVGKLKAEVLAGLDAIPKTHRMKYPAASTLIDGRRFPYTLFLEVSHETRHESIAPVGPLVFDYEFDERIRRRVIGPELVSEVTESLYRTPIAIEEKMYQPGFHDIDMDEPFQCKITLDDGSEFLMTRMTWETEFIVLPDGLPNSRISNVARVDIFNDVHRLQDAKKELPDPCVMYCLFRR